MPRLTTGGLDEGITYKFFLEILSILTVHAPATYCYVRRDLRKYRSPSEGAAGLAFPMLTSGLALAAGPGRLLLPMTLEGCSKAQGPGDAYPPALAGPCGVFVRIKRPCSRDVL